MKDAEEKEKEAAETSAKATVTDKKASEKTQKEVEEACNTCSTGRKSLEQRLTTLKKEKEADKAAK